MPTWPGTTGDVVTSTMWNGLPAFEVQTAKTADYTAASGDQYQQLVQINKASAIAFKLPTDDPRRVPAGPKAPPLLGAVPSRPVHAALPRSGA